MEENKKPQRARGLTSLTLGWIAERMRKAQAIKERLAKGDYSVDSEKLASAIASTERNK